MILDIINSNIDFLPHMNKVYVTENFYLKVVEFSDELKYATIKASKNSDFEPWFFETISTEDTHRFVDSVQTLYGLTIRLADRFNFSQESTTKAQGLIQAGFSALLRSEGGYMVDNIFPQTFLTQEELAYLAESNTETILLSDIK